MTTRSQIAAITDAGQFEELATAILRAADAVYAPIIHSGVNAGGRTIRAPVDGFVLSRDPLIFAGHTTCALSDLKGKWLHKVDGDLAKAVRERARLYQGQVAPPARLVLTTTREPDADLVCETRDACNAANLELDVWGQSRLADFLDQRGEGQWIRRRFLGTPQVRLSASLLAEIADLGPEALSRFDDPTAIIERAFEEELWVRTLDARGGLFLLAASGQGKSTVGANVWRKHASAGGYCVHLTHDDLDQSAALGEALSRSLTRSVPSLATGAASELLSLTTNMPILVLVDDVNRSANPLDAILKVVSWSAQVEGRKQQLVLLCPLWPHLLAALPQQAQTFVAERSINLPELSQSEAMRISRAHAGVQGATLSDHQFAQVVKRLGRDPLLLGLHDYRTTAHAGVGSFVDAAIARAAMAEGVAASDMAFALEKLSAAMLVHREMNPTWAAVRTWLPQEAELLNRIMLHGELVRRSGGLTEVVACRHDRVRDELLVRGFRAALADGSATDLLRDPFYSSLVGELLTRLDLNDPVVADVVAANPAALFSALRNFSPGAVPTGLWTLAEGWLDQPATFDRSHQHERWACQQFLLEVEALQVLGLVAKFNERNWFTLEAACLNGDMEAALSIAGTFDAGMTSPRHDQIFAHVRMKHGEAAFNFLDKELRTASAPKRYLAALSLAGRLADGRLEPALRVCWSQNEQDAPLVAEMLWAAAMCAPNLLPKVIKGWAKLDDEAAEDKPWRTDRNTVTTGSIRFALGKFVGTEALRVFLQAAKNRRLKSDLSYFMQSWDHPDAVEFVVRSLGEVSKKSERKGGFYPFLSQASEQWSEDRASGGRRMSPESRQRLQSLWGDEGEDIHVRRCALQIWHHAARRADLASVRRLDVNGPLGELAVVARAHLRDSTVVPAFAEKLRNAKNPGYFWQFWRRKWVPELGPIVEEHLDRRRTRQSKPDWSVDDSMLADVMMGMPEAVLEQTLQAHWDHLGSQARFVQLALFAATPVTRALAARSVAEAIEPQSIFQYIDMHYGIRSGGQNALTELRRFQSLEPYIPLMRPATLGRLADHCDDMGWIQWRREHLDPPLKGTDQQHYRGRDQRLARLDKALEEKTHNRALDYWAKDMVKQDGGASELLGAVDAWVRTDTSAERLEVGAEIVLAIGGRVHLPLLASWRGLGDGEADAVIIDAEYALKRRTLN